MSKMNRNLMSAALLVACAFGLVALSAAPAKSDEVVGDDASAQVARLHVLHAAYHESVSYNGDPLDRAEHLDLLETLFAPDATLTVGGNTFNGRDAVLDWYANSAGPFPNEPRGMNLVVNMEIEGIGYFRTLGDPKHRPFVR